MVSVGRHPNIELLTYSEVESVSGFVGNFDVKVRRKARYVNEDLCTGCGTCVEKCPWKRIPSDFDLGLGNRPAIYFQFAQAVPRVPVIDERHCAYFQRGKCGACERFCTKNAINFHQQDEILALEVGTIVLATGFKDFDPAISSQYGYRKLKNVFTGLEFERLVNSGGPTGGKIQLADGRNPDRVAIIHCVGSRGDQNEYCSRVCCMYSLKLAHLARDVMDAEVVEWTKRNCEERGTSFEITDDPAKGLDGAHVVYARNWMSPDAYQDGEFKKQGEIEKAMQITGWTLDAEKMARTQNAIFTHPMPVDRGNEVTDQVASGPRSAIYDIAENRLHVQKAVLALTMGNV